MQLRRSLFALMFFALVFSGLVIGGAVSAAHPVFDSVFPLNSQLVPLRNLTFAVTYHDTQNPIDTSSAVVSLNKWTAASNGSRVTRSW